MNENVNPNFNIDAKLADMINAANSIIANYHEKYSGCEASLEVCLAYDIKKYLPQFIGMMKE